MRVITHRQNARNDVSILVTEFNDRNARMLKIVMCAEFRIGDIQQATQKKRSKSLMRKQRYSLVRWLDRTVHMKIMIQFISQRGQQLIRSSGDTFHTATVILIRERGMLIPTVSQPSDFIADKQALGFGIFKKPSPLIITNIPCHFSPCVSLMTKVQQDLFLT